MSFTLRMHIRDILSANLSVQHRFPVKIFLDTTFPPFLSKKRALIPHEPVFPSIELYPLWPPVLPLSRLYYVRPSPPEPVTPIPARFLAAVAVPSWRTPIPSASPLITFPARFGRSPRDFFDVACPFVQRCPCNRPGLYSLPIWGSPV